MKSAWLTPTLATAAAALAFLVAWEPMPPPRPDFEFLACLNELWTVMRPPGRPDLGDCIRRAQSSHRDEMLRKFRAGK
jgi:hypothetical protein